MNYKEKLEEAKKLYASANADQKYVLESLFPELKKEQRIDDEILRKNLIKAFNTVGGRHWGGLEVRKILTWLEKQDDNTYSWKPTEEQYEALDYAYNSCPDTERGNYYEGVLETLIEDLHKLSEKQGEHPQGKSALEAAKEEKADNQNCMDDKVDPKFSEGEWITNSEYTWKIVDIKPLDYILQSQDGNIVDDSISYVDEHFHFFTVKDAKEGDVLMAGDVIFIFNKIHGVWINCHCSLHKDGSFYNEDYDLMHIKYSNEVYPATKEQKDALFVAMKDAGYEWDAERKKSKLLISNGGDFLPEVKESEDDKIRKEIIAYFKADWAEEEGITRPDWIAWLEKQGREDYNPYKVIIESIAEMCERYSQTMDWKDFYDNVKVKCKDAIEYDKANPENQGEQKSTIKMKTPEESLGIDSDTYNKIVDACIYDEQKPADKEYTFKAIPRLLEMVEPTDRAKAYCQKLIDSLTKERYFVDAKIVGECLRQMNGEDVPMATMDEQKPDDKVELKFHEGEWIVTDKNNVVQIKAVENDKYVLENTMRFSIDYVDKCWHLWTIQDAKDGDVLYAGGSHCYFKEYIFMFSSFTEDNVISTHFGYDVFHGTFDKDITRFGREEDFMFVTPATKKQRELLFQKMKEAGYEWDAEKKEPKKIEQSKLTEFEDAVKDMMNTYRDAIGDCDATAEEVKKHAAYMLSLIPLKPIVEWKPSEEQMDALESAVSSLQSSTLETLYQDLKREKNYE